MSTFRQMPAYDVLYAARDTAHTPGGIIGLRVADADRVFPHTGRTTNGFKRPSTTPWDAHHKLDQFKTLADVENVTEKGEKGLVLKLSFTDGSSEWLHHTDLLVIEDPVTGTAPTV